MAEDEDVGETGEIDEAEAEKRVGVEVEKKV